MAGYTTASANVLRDRASGLKATGSFLGVVFVLGVVAALIGVSGDTDKTLGSMLILLFATVLLGTWSVICFVGGYVLSAMADSVPSGE